MNADVAFLKTAGEDMDADINCDIHADADADITQNILLNNNCLFLQTIINTWFCFDTIFKVMLLPIRFDRTVIKIVYYKLH